MSDQAPTPTTAYRPLREEPGEVVAGRYHLLEKIGEGGMGAVWVARQSEPVQRKVAVKLIKPGMGSPRVLARFEAERQALALMDHPNIAKVLDGGITEDGRSYFVMELINGLPLTKYCDEARLTPRQRLELFVHICQAVQHAHQKGIIHRDLKPSNVLVTLYDGQPVPKVIDFGVAKALAGKLTDETDLTQFGTVVGTLEYMAPEQAGFSATDVDTRADIYSLGVMLYELLTGLRPFDAKRLRAAALDEAVRILREEEPPRPSTRVSTDASAPSLAQARQSDAKALARLMRGELDWVVMKCLEKDRTRRYETANGLARDIQRYLADEPVEARPPSTAYRLRKLFRRNRGAVLAGLAFVGLLLGATGVRGGRGLGANRARARATGAEAEAREQEKQARASQSESQAVLEFFRQHVLSAGRPRGQEGGLGRLVTLRQAVDAAEPRIAREFADRPLAEAAIRHAMGTTYWYLDEFPAAMRQYERCVELRRKHLGEDHAQTLQAMYDLASTYAQLPHDTRGLPLYEEVLRRQKATLGEDHLDTVRTMGNLGMEYSRHGLLVQGRQMTEAAYKRKVVLLGADDGTTLLARHHLAGHLITAGRVLAALAEYEAILPRMRARLGADHPNTIIALESQADLHASVGRFDQALRELEEAVRLYREQYGPSHRHPLRAMNTLAAVHEMAGQPDKARAIMEEVVRLAEPLFGPDRHRVVNYRVRLVNLQDRPDKHAVIIGLRQRLYDRYRTTLGADHRDTLAALHNLAEAHGRAGQHDRAIELYKLVVERRKATLGADHHHTLLSLGNLAHTYGGAGRQKEAIPLNEENVRRQTAALGADHKETRLAANNLAVNLLNSGQRKEAIAQLEPLLKQFQADMGPVHFQTRLLATNLAVAYRQAGQFDQCVAALEQHLKGVRAQLGDDHRWSLDELRELANQHRLAGRWSPAKERQEEALKKCLARFGADHADTRAILNDLALTHFQSGTLKRAGELYEQLLAAERRASGPGHPRTVRALGELANTYERLGNNLKAAPLFAERLAGLEKLQGRDAPDTLQAMWKAAFNTGRSGDLERCVTILEDQLERCRRRYGHDHLETATVLHNLGAWMLNRPVWAERSLRAFREAHRIHLAVGKAGDPMTLNGVSFLAQTYTRMKQPDRAAGLLEAMRDSLKADTEGGNNALNLLAVHYFKQDQFAKAAPLFVQAHQGARKLWGVDGNETQNRLTNLSHTFERLKRFDDALRLHEDRLREARAKYGPRHRFSLFALEQLAQVNARAGRVARALALSEQTAMRMYDALGGDDFLTRRAIDHLADLYLDTGRPAWAASLYERLWHRERDRLGPGHPQALAYLLYLGLARENAGHLQEAEAVLRQTVASYRELPVRRNAQELATALQVLGVTRLRQKKPAEALLREALALRQQYDRDGVSLWSALSVLGEALIAGGRMEEGEKLLREGYRGVKAGQAQYSVVVRRQRVREALERFVTGLEALGKRDEAKQWQAERMALPP